MRPQAVGWAWARLGRQDQQNPPASVTVGLDSRLVDENFVRSRTQNGAASCVPGITVGVSQLQQSRKYQGLRLTKENEKRILLEVGPASAADPFRRLHSDLTPNGRQLGSTASECRGISLRRDIGSAA